ncbi:MAG TPA: carbohydrate ABC transporter permease, partial [Trebonia sp.]
MSATKTVSGSPATEAGPRPPRLARRRPRRGGGRKRHSVLLNILMTVMLLYALLPLFWLVVNSTKTQGAL